MAAEGERIVEQPVIPPRYILGIKTTPAPVDDLHRAIAGLVDRGDAAHVLSANVHGLNLARRNPWLRDFYEAAELVRVDGAGVVLGFRLLGRRIPARLTWADWGWLLARFCASRGLSLYFLGGLQGAAAEAAERLREHAPGVMILETRHGYFEKTGRENEEVIEAINRSGADILIVGLGMPLQEKWLQANAGRLEVPVRMTCGAAFEYLAGWKQRCPEWMGRLGLEWLYRLGQEPRRMFKRYIWGNSVFLFNVVRQKLGLIRL